MEINVLVDEKAAVLDEAWLRSIAEQVLVAQNIGPGVELGLLITGQERIQQLNRDYRGRDEPIDVLAFSTEEAGSLPFITPPDGIRHLGEVIISYPQAVIQAEEHRHSAQKEMAILIIHGVLHLLGYEDEKPELKRQMAAREQEILSYIEGELE